METGEGFVREFVAEPGARVQEGDPLIVCEDPVLVAEVRVLHARMRELTARFRQHWPTELVKAAMVQEEMKYVAEELAQARQRMDDLIIKSQVDGRFVVPLSADMPGRFVRRGEQLGYVVDLTRNSYQGTPAMEKRIAGRVISRIQGTSSANLTRTNGPSSIGSIQRPRGTRTIACALRNLPLRVWIQSVLIGRTIDRRQTLP